jgi:hypothetical protein
MMFSAIVPITAAAAADGPRQRPRLSLDDLFQFFDYMQQGLKCYLIPMMMVPVPIFVWHSSFLQS